MICVTVKHKKSKACIRMKWTNKFVTYTISAGDQLNLRCRLQLLLGLSACISLFSGRKCNVKLSFYFVFTLLPIAYRAYL